MTSRTRHISGDQDHELGAAWTEGGGERWRTRGEGVVGVPGEKGKGGRGEEGACRAYTCSAAV
jgi:hypothetical protein